MKRIILIIFTVLFFICSNYAQEVDSIQLKIDAIENSLIYETGTIDLEPGNAKLTVPVGFRYLSKNQSIYVLTDLWGNPSDSSVIGMLVPVNTGVLGMDSWVFTINYDDMGYVEDDDAEDIDYDDLLKDQQKEIKESNPERIKLGYQPIDFIGWASHPYYDKNKNTLHWAKELKFGQDSLNTLNYNLRLLGRKGIYLLNAIASVNQLEQVKLNVDKVIASIEFKDGNKYADYSPGVDQVAAWTIGGLVAGKVLAKVGFFVVILKFWKLIALAIIGAVGPLWKYFKGRKKKEEIFIDANK